MLPTTAESRQGLSTGLPDDRAGGRMLHRRIENVLSYCKHEITNAELSTRLRLGLPRVRGRTYVRNGSVCHLNMRPGQIERAVTEGRAKDYADVAGQLGLSRARVSQVMNLRLLSPRIQEVLLTEPHRAGRISERRLRPITETLDWRRQWEMFHPMLTAAEGPDPSDHCDPARGSVTLSAAAFDDPHRPT